MRGSVLVFLLCLSANAENLLSNQPGTAIPAATWTQLSLAGIIAHTNGFDNHRYNKSIDRGCSMMELNPVTTEQNRDLWCSSFKENRWDLFAHAGSFHGEHTWAGGHSDDQIAPEFTSGWIWAMNGMWSGGSSLEIPMLSFSFDPMGLYGRSFDQTSPTGAAQRSYVYGQERSMGYDSSRLAGGAQGMFVKTGAGSGSSEYDLLGNSFQATVSQATIGNTIESCITYDRLDQATILMFGKISSTPTANVWSYKGGTWAQLTPTADPVNGSPAARVFPACAHNRNRDHILVLSGCSIANISSCGAGTIYTDTWMLDRSVNYPNGQWKLLAGTANGFATGGNSPYPTAVSAIFERLDYYEEDDVYLSMTADDKVWAFREDPGNNAGYTPSSYTVVQGLNIASNAWAMESSFSISGSNFLAGWVEEGIPGQSPTGAQMIHPNVKQFNGTVWQTLPGTYDSQALIPTGLPGQYGISGDMGCAYVSSNPWCAFHFYNTNLGIAHYGEQWNGTNWRTVGGQIAKVSAGAAQPAQHYMISVAGVPTLAFTEDDWTVGIPHKHYLYVEQWNGSSWSAPLGGGKLNRLTETSSFFSRVERFYLVPTTGSNFCIAWTEYLTNVATQEGGEPPQVFVSCWNGTSFVAQGASLLLNTNDNAQGVALTYVSSTNTLYCAFNERVGNPFYPQNGFANIPKMYVESSAVGSGTWTLVGGSYVNRDQHSGWTASPSLDTDGTNIYLAFDEQGVEFPWEGSPTRLVASATVGHVYVLKWNGSGWFLMGGALNQDPIYGSATNPKLKMSSGNPVVLFEEVKAGTMQQIYVKQWNGVDWVSVPSPGIQFSTPSPLPSGKQNQAYSTNVTVINGVGNLTTCAVVTGSLPTGLSITSCTSNILTISGTPTGSGTSTFSLQATDSNSNSTPPTQYQITINPSCTSPTITSGNPPNGTVGTAYSFTFTATGDAPLSYTASGIPAGLSLNSVTGVLSGTPTTAATYTLLLTVSNGCGQQTGAPTSYTIVISPAAPPLQITTSSLPNGTVGSPYSQTMAATGGTPPYTWAVTLGSLPVGITMSSGGVISGTPTTPQTVTFTIQVTDNVATTASKQYTITISSNLTITSTSPLPATAIAPYLFTFQATGGTTPYSWALVSGTLPPGLALGNSGVLSGTPQAIGTFTFTVGVTDAAAANAQGVFSLTIGEGAVIINGQIINGQLH